MPAIPMNVIAGQLTGSCFPNEQARLNAYAQALQVTFPLTASAFNYGSSVPTTDQQALPWYRLNSDGTPDKWYAYINGNWISPNPIPPSGSMSYFFNGDLAGLAVYDGGEGGYTVDSTSGIITPTIAISATTGPMWQVDTTMQGSTALGVSNVSVIQKDSRGNIINQWAQGTNIGEVQHTLSDGEQGRVIWGVGKVASSGGGGTAVNRVFVNGVNGDVDSATNSSSLNGGGGTYANGTFDAVYGHNNIQPSRVGYWVQRTARIFYRI